MDKLANITDARVREKPGRGWVEWVEALDHAGGAALSHKQIALLLQEQHGLDAWWAQSVTVGYEQAKGRRAEHEKAGGFSASVSRTVTVPIEEVHAAWASGAWLTRVPGAEITKATPPKSIRIRLADGTRAAVYLTAKSGEKTAIQVEHEKLPGAEAVEPSRALWREVIALVAGTPPE
jgi:hypothetical protein